MANPVADVWSDPVDGANGQPQFDRILHVYYWKPVGSSIFGAMGVAFTLPGVQREPLHWQQLPGTWQDHVYPMKNGKRSPTAEVREWVFEGDMPLTAYPVDENIPPVTDLALEYAA